MKRYLNFYFFIVTLCSAIGLYVSLVLLEHNIGISSEFAEAVCGTSLACDTVNKSDVSSFLGLPLAFFGFLFYFLILVLRFLAFKLQQQNFLTIIFWFSLVGVVVDFVLLIYSLLLLETVCPLCAITYVCSVAILIFVSLDLLQRKDIAKRFHFSLNFFLGFNTKQVFLTTSSIFSVFLVSLLLLVVLRSNASADISLSTSEQLLEKSWQQFKLRYDNTNEKVIPITNSASKGAIDPVITIVEFADYLCPHCRTATEQLQDIANKYANVVKIVYKNYPIDQECNINIKQPFHIGSCKLSYVTYCAQQQSMDLFWKINKLIFDQQPQYLERRRFAESDMESLLLSSNADISSLKNCILDPKTKQSIEQDIALGDALDVHGTPSIFINGRRMVGIPIAYFLERLLQFEIKNKISNTSTK